MDLCITADDYGLSSGANDAIEALAAEGRISAASVMAHRDAELSSVRELASTGIAMGLHLCFTDARPLTGGLGPRLPESYPRLFAAIARHPSMIARLRAEAEAQADRLLDAGVTVAFVNGHEHVHLFPPLWPIAAGLTRRLCVPGARAVRAAIGQPIDLSRAGALAAASRVAWALAPIPDAVVLSPLGVGSAGALTIEAVDALLSRPFTPAPGVIRELCVHPSRDEPGRRAEHAIVASGAIARLLARRGLRMTRGIPLTGA